MSAINNPIASGGGGMTQLTGDVTATGTGIVAATIAPDAVTYDKLQNVSAASKLLGRGSAAGAGDAQEIALGTGLAMSGTTLNGNVGSVSSLTGDVTGSGTGAVAATIANNAVTYAKLQDVSAASKLLGRGDGGSGDPQEITLGSNLAMSGTTLNASAAAVSAASKLIGRGDGGAGAQQEIALGAGLVMSGTTLREGGTATLTDGATPALDASLGAVFRLAAGGDRTIGIPSNPITGQKIVIQHYASAAARTLALNTGTGGFRFGSDVTALTQTASGKTDYIGAIYNATDNKWDVVAVSKGY